MWFRRVFLQTWGDRSELLEDRKELWSEMHSLTSARLANSVSSSMKAGILGNTGDSDLVSRRILLLPTLDVSINMISLFAFIVTWGLSLMTLSLLGKGFIPNGNKVSGLLMLRFKERRTRDPCHPAILTNMIVFAPYFCAGRIG